MERLILVEDYGEDRRDGCWTEGEYLVLDKEKACLIQPTVYSRHTRVISQMWFISTQVVTALGAVMA